MVVQFCCLLLYLKYYFNSQQTKPIITVTSKKKLNITFFKKWLARKLSPLESPALSSSDFYLKGHLKSMAYNPSLKTLGELRANFEREIKKLRKMF